MMHKIKIKKSLKKKKKKKNLLTTGYGPPSLFSPLKLTFIIYEASRTNKCHDLVKKNVMIWPFKLLTCYYLAPYVSLDGKSNLTKIF
jgi:hypothetical protein